MSVRPEPGGTQLRSVGINCRHLGVISSNYPKEREEQPDRLKDSISRSSYHTGNLILQFLGKKK